MGLIISLAALLYLIYVITLIVLSIISMRRDSRRFSGSFSGILYLLSEILFTIIAPAIGFIRYDEFGAEIPFATRHVPVIILITIVSSASFWIARFSAGTVIPLLRIIISAGLLQGMIFCVFTSIHFIPFLPLGIIYPMFGFELLAPLIAFFMLLREFTFYNRVRLDLSELLPYRAELGFIPLAHQAWRLPLTKRMTLYTALVIMFLASQSLFVYLLGADIDSLVKAYSHSHGFIFSTH